MPYLLPGDMDTFYDNSKPFSTFLRKEGLKDILCQMKLKLREQHTIVPHVCPHTSPWTVYFQLMACAARHGFLESALEFIAWVLGWRKLVLLCTCSVNHISSNAATYLDYYRLSLPLTRGHHVMLSFLADKVLIFENYEIFKIVLSKN